MIKYPQGYNSCAGSPPNHTGAALCHDCVSPEKNSPTKKKAEHRLRFEVPKPELKHLLIAVWLERVVDSFDELHLITDWIMTEERRIQDICLGNQEICGSAKAVNIRQVV